MVNEVGNVEPITLLLCHGLAITYIYSIRIIYFLSSSPSEDKHLQVRDNDLILYPQNLANGVTYRRHSIRYNTVDLQYIRFAYLKPGS